MGASTARRVSSTRSRAFRRGVPANGSITAWSSCRCWIVVGAPVYLRWPTSIGVCSDASKTILSARGWYACRCRSGRRVGWRAAAFSRLRLGERRSAIGVGSSLERLSADEVRSSGTVDSGNKRLASFMAQPGRACRQADGHMATFSSRLRGAGLSARRVIVLGGGLAGITAALDCAEAGARVTLFEVRPRLGGAAYSFEREGLLLDNGQHVFLRCCTAYRGLLARLGSERRVMLQPRLEIPVLSPGHDQVVLRRNGLPAPLHLAGALLRYSHLTLTQRLSAARAALALGRLDLSNASGTLGEWLAAHGQDAASVSALWDLIVLPTLNLAAAEGALALGAFVLQTGLLRRNDAGDIGFHVRPLSETLGDPAARVLADAGVGVRLGVRVEAVERLRVRAGGAELEADAVVC